MSKNLALRTYRALRRRIDPDQRDFQRFLKDRTTLEFAPYPLSRLETLLQTVKSQRHEELLNFSDKSAALGKRAWYIRLDLDTSACVENAPFVIETVLKYGVRPGVFLRTTAEDYEISAAKLLFDRYEPEGVLFGLHSECYLDDDWRARLDLEVAAYLQVIGAAPSAINAHGHGAVRRKVRAAFYASLTSDFLEQYGSPLNDCGTGDRSYGLIVQDCHFDERFLRETEKKRRFLLSDFRDPPPTGVRAAILILVHPTYWMRPAE
jgi:hypothetical protein